ncbi:MAG: DEAD/DEAH box helicase family protein, partial [Aliarcobacter butzleri]|nr:DEAD/DEAH box helicase family protein [Aliarcobacter butzleri]
DVGRVYSKHSAWEKKIVVSTWQSLKNHLSNIKRFDCVIVDECHGSRADVMRNILKESSAEYRIGCTGTMPDERLDELQIKSYLGPVVVDVSASELADLGYISQIQVLQYIIHHKTKFSKDYNEAKTEIFQNDFRLNIIKNIVDLSKQSILLLVGKVEVEGKFLKRYLTETLQYNEDNIVFISGSMEAQNRELWRQKIIQNPNEKYIIIATVQCFSTGINIPNLSTLVFASPFKSKIPVLQSIGRVLRKHHSKNGAIVYDIIDENNKWFPKYGDIRYRYYTKEKFDVIVKNLYT